jgi:hypothetical protein
MSNEYENIFQEELKNWEGPFHLFANISNSMCCARLKDDRFHIYKPGEPTIILTGYGFILIKEPILSIFKKLCANTAEFKDATVKQTVQGENFSGYYEVDPHEEISPDNSEHIDSSGFKLWHFDKRYLFVSIAVKNELSKLNIKGISFTPGFSEFA